MKMSIGEFYIKTMFYCPKCSRMLFTDGMILTSYPPMINVKCKNCNYRGYRDA